MFIKFKRQLHIVAMDNIKKFFAFELAIKYKKQIQLFNTIVSRTPLPLSLIG